MFQLSLPFVIILLVLLFNAIKILNEYERGVIFRFGHFIGVKGPGLIFLIPGIDKMKRVDLRTVTMDIPSQDIITMDNVTLKVNGVVYFRVNEPDKAIIAVEDFLMATGQISGRGNASALYMYDQEKKKLIALLINNNNLEIIAIRDMQYDWEIDVFSAQGGTQKPSAKEMKEAAKRRRK